jgi:hypothetical protein
MEDSHDHVASSDARSARPRRQPRTYMTPNHQLILEHLLTLAGVFYPEQVARDTGVGQSRTSVFLRTLKREGFITDDPEAVASKPGAAAALAEVYPGRRRHHYCWTETGPAAARRWLDQRRRLRPGSASVTDRGGPAGSAARRAKSRDASGREPAVRTG